MYCATCCIMHNFSFKLVSLHSATTATMTCRLLLVTRHFLFVAGSLSRGRSLRSPHQLVCSCYCYYYCIINIIEKGRQRQKGKKGGDFSVAPSLDPVVSHLSVTSIENVSFSFWVFFFLFFLCIHRSTRVSIPHTHTHSMLETDDTLFSFLSVLCCLYKYTCRKDSSFLFHGQKVSVDW